MIFLNSRQWRFARADIIANAPDFFKREILDRRTIHNNAPFFTRIIWRATSRRRTFPFPIPHDDNAVCVDVEKIPLIPISGLSVSFFSRKNCRPYSSRASTKIKLAGSLRSECSETTFSCDSFLSAKSSLICWAANCSCFEFAPRIIFVPERPWNECS